KFLVLNMPCFGLGPHPLRSAMRGLNNVRGDPVEVIIDGTHVQPDCHLLDWREFTICSPKTRRLPDRVQARLVRRNCGVVDSAIYHGLKWTYLFEKLLLLG